MTTLAKAGIAITGIGTVGGGIAIANNLLSAPEVKKTLLNKLIDEGFEEVPEDQWQTILEEYKKIKDTKTTFKKDNEEVEDLQGLKAKCQSALSQKDASEDNYKKARQWCVKPEDINSILVRAKYKVLSTSTEDDVAIWTKKAFGLKNDAEVAKSLAVDIISKDEKTIGTKLKEVCKGIKITEIKTINKDFNDNFEKVRTWCSEKK